MGLFDALGPIGAVAGVGLSLAGGLMGSAAAKDAFNEEKAIAGFESAANNERLQAMEINARRGITQNLRQSQMARSVALNNATSQGAQFGSGLQGGYGTVSGGANTNILGINQNLDIGRKIFNIDDQINAAKIELAKDQSGMATDQGLMSMGSAIGGISDKLGKLGSVNLGSLFS